MKIIEAQSAVLSNYEVYKNLVEQKEKYKKIKRRGPPNLETVVRELLQYSEAHPNPLSGSKTHYTPESIGTLIERLQPYDLSKGEVMMIINLRPHKIEVLNAVLEDIADRYTDEQQLEMIEIIADVLGDFEERDQDGAAAGQEDEQMADATS